MDDLGARGERAAARWLRHRGWRILERRWRGMAGEIDVVAERRGLLALCEVKTRSARGALVDPIPFAQRARIAATADEYVARNPGRGRRGTRVDLLVCRPGRLGVMRVRRVAGIDVGDRAAGRGRPSAGRAGIPRGGVVRRDGIGG